jgi:hypothetical protein
MLFRGLPPLKGNVECLSHRQGNGLRLYEEIERWQASVCVLSARGPQYHVGTHSHHAVLASDKTYTTATQILLAGREYGLCYI